MAASSAETAELLELLDASIARTRTAGRPDLAEKLVKSRDQLTSGAWHVLVAGEFKRGKSALVNALLGLPVCGSDPIAYTAVPTIVRHGERPRAGLVEETEAAERPPTRPIDIRDAAGYGLRGTTEDGTRLRAVEVSVPRQLLADGLVLIDTPGLGGGFAAAGAAATMRALALADGVLVVTDASQELTAAEVDFIKHTVSVCPNLLCVLTKTDFYPQWRRILDINRGHLRDAGVAADIIAVSAPLRELAIDTGDPALLAESGFPVLVDRLRSRLLAGRAEAAHASAAAAVRTSLAQVADSLATEHTALTEPDQRATTMRRVAANEERARNLAGPSSSRWLNTINDRFADLQARLEVDLSEVCRRLEADATRRIKEGNPTREWPEIVPWLQRSTNEALTDVHTRLIGMVDAVAGDIAAVFDSSATDVDATAGAGGLPAVDIPLNPLSGRKAGKVEVGMQAARGWSLSSSLVTTLLVTTLHPGLLIALPITATLGAVFAIKAVRGYQSGRVDAARNEAVRAVAGYLGQSRVDASRAALDLIRHSRGRIRDYFLDKAAELASSARHEQQAAQHAMTADEQTAAARGAQAKAELTQVSQLLAKADRLAGAVS